MATTGDDTDGTPRPALPLAHLPLSTDELVIFDPEGTSRAWLRSPCYVALDDTR